jgi:hypothetical protein
VEGTGFTDAPTEVFLFRGRQPPVAFTVANDTDWCNITTSELVLSYYKPGVSTLQRMADAQGAWRPVCSHDQCDVKRAEPDDRRATASLPLTISTTTTTSTAALARPPANHSHTKCTQLARVPQTRRRQRAARAPPTSTLDSTPSANQFAAEMPSASVRPRRASAAPSTHRPSPWLH